MPPAKLKPAPVSPAGPMYGTVSSSRGDRTVTVTVPKGALQTAADEAAIASANGYGSGRAEEAFRKSLFEALTIEIA